ncbi:MAG: hypothetical protein ACI84C_000536 [Flavobacteriales bacterium]|jgi:hypothetical protein
MRKLLCILIICGSTLIGFWNISAQSGPYVSLQGAQDTLTAQADSTIVKLQPQMKTPTQGVIEVSFKIDKNGEVEVTSINSDNPELIGYIMQRLKKIKLDPAIYHTGQVIKYKFDFNKQM